MLDNEYPEEEVAPGQPVAQTIVRDCLVSTVRLPFPSPLSGYEYETMIRSGHDWLDYQTRCKTLELAKFAHAEACAWVRKDDPEVA